MRVFLVALFALWSVAASAQHVPSAADGELSSILKCEQSAWARVTDVANTYQKVVAERDAEILALKSELAKKPQ